MPGPCPSPARPPRPARRRRTPRSPPGPGRWRRGCPAGRPPPATPATPMATSVTPRRQVRPKVSDTTTPTDDAVTVLERLADPPGRAVGVDREQGGGPGSTLERSTPALAQTNPWRVSVISRSPRRADDPHRLATRPGGCLAPGSSGSMATSRPSALDTTFWVTTSTSPSTSPPAAGPVASAATTSAGQVVARGRPRPSRRPGGRSGPPTGAPRLRRGHRAPSGPAPPTAPVSTSPCGSPRSAPPRPPPPAARCGVGLVDDQGAHPRARTTGPRRPPRPRSRARRAAGRPVP